MSDTEYTVVFVGHSKNIKGNPFDVVTEFGRVISLSVGNVCEDADCFRDALEEIAERGSSKEASIAQRALDARDAALTAALAAGRSK